MSFFNYYGKKVYYKEIGNGDPLLLLHGNTASSKMFEDILSLYTPQYKVILIDFLGHGKSQRLDEFPVDFWFDEGQQVITLLKERKLEKVNIIGTSGGALAAINVALEAPEVINKVIADSFEGEEVIKSFTENIIEDREKSKSNRDAQMFYEYMQGTDWQSVVDNDTQAIVKHSKYIGKFFHKSLENLKVDILLTGSKGDELICASNEEFFQCIYRDIIRKVGHGKIYLFESGGHPAMLSNREEFAKVAINFLK